MMSDEEREEECRKMQAEMAAFVKSAKETKTDDENYEAAVERAAIEDTGYLVLKVVAGLILGVLYIWIFSGSERSEDRGKSEAKALERTVQEEWDKVNGY